MPPVITQTVEWDEDVHLPMFGTQATSYGFAEEEAQEQQEATLNRFSRDSLGNSSADVSEGADSDVPAQK